MKPPGCAPDGELEPTALDLHLVAEWLEPLDMALDDQLAVLFVAVIGSEMFMASAVAEHADSMQPVGA